MQSEFGTFDHRGFSIEYPIDWMNITRRATKFRQLPIVAYGYRSKRKGLLGAIADAIYWRMDAEFAIFSLPLKEVRAKLSSEPKSDADAIVFDYILSRFGLSKTGVEVLVKQKEVLSGRRSYHLTVNASGRQYEFHLVIVSKDVGIMLRHVAPLRILGNFKETFERMVQSFKMKG